MTPAWALPLLQDVASHQASRRARVLPLRPALQSPGFAPPQPRLELCRCGEPLELECERDEGLCVNCQAELAGCSNGILVPEVAA